MTNHRKASSLAPEECVMLRNTAHFAASAIDAALTRAGRLDRHIRIHLSDAKGREGILM